jgi:uncharacterized protein YecT (DUF1311 family)
MFLAALIAAAPLQATAGEPAALRAGVNAASTPAAADTAYKQCLDSTSTLLDWGECGEAWLDRLQVELNLAWKRARGSVDVQGRKALLTEQRAWLKFRDSSCTFWAEGSYGRNGQVLSFIGCRAAIVEARISDLNGIYEFMREHE